MVEFSCDLDEESLGRGFEEAGCEELIMFPASADPAHVDALASIVL